MGLGFYVFIEDASLGAWEEAPSEARISHLPALVLLAPNPKPLGGGAGRGGAVLRVGVVLNKVPRRKHLMFFYISKKKKQSTRYRSRLPRPRLTSRVVNEQLQC